ncbi:unnamed protein product [Onchocerca flexuosa]|uniref:CUB domain protein n=1 Tax=Onchocerca flexuosa TaxID=387005 RepID=A0A183GXR5_9BILA|nr:unnamed protein product [Onchocerca flexuosa]
MRGKILKIKLHQITQIYSNCVIYRMANIGFTYILSSCGLANYRITFLIPYLYLSFLLRLTTTSLASCRFIFDYFHLSPRTDRLFDGVQDGLIDEKTAYNGEFCAREIQVGQTFYSYTRYLIFHVQLSSTSKGFHGTYNLIPKERFLSNATEIEPCHFRVDILAGNLFSPNYPYFYPTTANCTYYLAPRQGFNLVISLEYLNLRRYACHEDFIDIYQIYPKVHLEKLCYDSIPPYQISTKGGYIIEFHGTNNDIAKVSHLFDHSEFGEMTLSVINDVHNDDKIGSRERCPVRITSPSVVDDNLSFSSTSGILNSSQYVNDDEPFKCQFIFLGSGNEKVQITFLYFNLYTRVPHFNNNNTTNRCDEMDHLSAHVLIGTRMSRIEDFCGSETPPRLMSTKNLLTLDYVIRSTKAARRMMANVEKFGFVLKYQFRSDLGLSEMNADIRNDLTCHYEFNSSWRSSGHIFSPNHPGYYPRNIDCHYIFHGSDKQVVVIHFEYFDIEGLTTCDDSTHSDYVLFSNYQTQDRTNRRYCGQVCPKDSIVSESNYFRMLFRSNDIFDATGFYAHYQFITERKSLIKLS